MKSLRKGISGQLVILCLIIILQLEQCCGKKCLKDFKDAGVSAENPVKCDGWNDDQGRHNAIEDKVNKMHFKSRAPDSTLKVYEPHIHVSLEIQTKTLFTAITCIMNFMMVLYLLRMLVLSSNRKCTINKAEKIQKTEEGEKLVLGSDDEKSVEYLTDVESSNTDVDYCQFEDSCEEKSYDILNNQKNSGILSNEDTCEPLQQTDQWGDSPAVHFMISYSGNKDFDEVEVIELSGNKLIMNESNTGKNCRLEVDSRRELCPLDFQFPDLDVEEDPEVDEETFLKFTHKKVDTCSWVGLNNFSKPVSKTVEMIRHTQFDEDLGTQKSGYEGHFKMTSNDSIWMKKDRETCSPDPIQCTDKCEEGYMISMKRCLSILEKVIYSDHMSGKAQSQDVPESSYVSSTLESTCLNVAEAELYHNELIKKPDIVLDEARVGNCTSYIHKSVSSTKDTDVLTAFPTTNLDDDEDNVSTHASFHSHKKSNNEVGDEPVESFGYFFPCLSQRPCDSEFHQAVPGCEELWKKNDTSFQSEASDLETDHSCSIPIGSDSSGYFLQENERYNCPHKPELSFMEFLRSGTQNAEKRWYNPVDHTQDDDNSKKTKQKESTRMKSVLHGNSLRWYFMPKLQSLTPGSGQQSKKRKRKQYHTSLSRYKKKTVKNFFKKYHEKHLRNIVTWPGSYLRNARHLNTVTTFPTSDQVNGGQLSGVDIKEHHNQSSGAEAAATSAAANSILPTNGDGLREQDEDLRGSNLSIDYPSSLRFSLDSYFSSVISGCLSSSDEEMIYEWKRLQSFEHFPLNCPVSPLHLARDGWYYGNDGDTVICFSCQATHSGWTYGSNTRSFHHPACRFILGCSANVPIHMTAGNAYLPMGQVVPNQSPKTTPPASSQESSESGRRMDWALVGNGTDRQQTSVRQPEMLSRGREPQVIAQTSSASEHLLQQLPQEQHSQQQHGFATGHSHYPESTVVQQQQGVVQQQQDTALQQQNTATHQNTAIQQQTSRPTDTTNMAQTSRPTDTTNMAQSAVSQAPGRAINAYSMNNQSAATNLSANPSPRPQPNATPSPLGINFEKPRFPSYAVLSTRINTFQEWSAKGFSQTPQAMASAGFYYAGYGDYVRCFFCSGGLRNWEIGDDPWVEHARWYPDCTFVRQNKGDRFVEAIQQARNPESDLVRERQTSNTTDSSKNEMDSAAVLSIKEMGYTTEQIKKALSEMKKRLGAGRHTVTAQDLLEVIFEIVERERVEQRDENSAVKKRQSSNSSPNAAASQSASKSKTEKKSSIPNTDKGGKKSSLDKKENSVGDKGGKKSSLEKKETSIGDKGGKKSSLDKKENSKDNTADGTGSGSSNLTEEELRSLKEENTHLKEQIMCKICMDNNVSVAFLPCGHLACCRECAPAMRKCPICREFVKGVVKTYLA